MNLFYLSRLGIAARLAPCDEIVLEAPCGVLTATLVDAVRQAKPALINELRHFGEGVNVVNNSRHCANSDQHVATATAETSFLGANQLFSMSADEEKTVRAWLIHIGESDPETIAEVLQKCHQEPAERAFILDLATVELPKPDPFDDRRTCNQCANLIGRQCLAAKRGQIAASRDYEPIRDVLHRCKGYCSNAQESPAGMATP